MRSGEADRAGVGKDGGCDILGLGVLGVRSVVDINKDYPPRGQMLHEHLYATSDESSTILASVLSSGTNAAEGYVADGPVL